MCEQNRPDAGAKGPVGLGAKAAIGALWLYQRTLSPAFYLVGVRCRHQPTCSHYGIEAYRLHGLWRGSWLTLARLCRCHPFGSHGFDPVPRVVQAHPLAPWKYGDWSWRAREREKRHARGDGR